MIGTTFYHGSAVPSITALKVNWDRDSAFGPAIYLTAEPTIDYDVIYKVKLKANQLLTINLDKSFSEQTIEAKEAILKTRKCLGLPKLLSRHTNVKALIQSSDNHSKAEVNRILLEHGIWMLYGNSESVKAVHTKQDQMQYAVIDESAIILVNKTQQKNLYLKSVS